MRTVDLVVLVVGLVMFVVGVVVGASWRVSLTRRVRPALALPDERPRRATGGRR